MKNIFIILISFLAFNLSAQSEIVTSDAAPQSEIKTAKFKTSAECGMCKKRIEKALGKVEGISYSKLNVPTKILKVKYDSDKLCEEDIRMVVASVGYDADNVEADAKAYKKLPKCCKKGGMSH